MDLFGTSRKDLEDDFDAVIADKDGRPSRYHGHFLHKDGALVPIEARRRALHTDNGWIIVATARDISERKKAERSFQELLEFAPDAMVLANQAGEIVLVNAQTVTLFGWASEALLGLKMDIRLASEIGRASCRERV